MEYRPSFRSFLETLAYDLSPICTAGVVIYFTGRTANFLVWVASGVMALFSLLLVLQSIIVYRKKLYLDEAGIAVSGIFSRNAMRWSEVTGAVLRERKNAVSRTDRMLVLESKYKILNYVTSILSPRDEEEVLAKTRQKARLVSYQDKPTI